MTSCIVSEHVSKVMIATLTVLLLTGLGAAEVISVDDDGEADNETISEAVDFASSGDTIIVEEGTYEEQVVLNRESISNLTIEAAEDASERPLVYNESSETAEPTFAVDTDQVTIEGLEVVRNNSNANTGQAVRVAGDGVALTNNSYEVGAKEDAAIAVLTDSSNAAGNPDFEEEISSVEIQEGEIVAKGSDTKSVLIANSTEENATFAEGSLSVNDVTFNETSGNHFLELNSSVSTFDVRETLLNNEFTKAAGVSEAGELILGDYNITSKISTTIQSVENVALEDAKVEISEGNYKENLTLSTNGLGMTSVDPYNRAMLNFTPSEPTGSATIDVQASDVEVSDLDVFRGAADDRKEDGGHAQGIVIREPDVDIRNLNVSGALDTDNDYDRFDGVIVLDSDNANVDGVEIEGFYAGLVVSQFSGDGVDTATISDSEIRGNNDGIVVKRHEEDEPTKNVSIETTSIESNDERSIYLPVDSYQGFDLEPINATEVEVGDTNIYDDLVNEDNNSLQAAHNYWGAASGPNTSGTDVVGNVAVEPWLLAEDGDRFEQTNAVVGGEWSLLSTPREIEETDLQQVENGSSQVLHYDTDEGEFVSGSVDSPLGATFIYTDYDAGVGMNYTDEEDFSREISEGWNMVGTSEEVEVKHGLATASDSLNAFSAPDMFNDWKAYGFTGFGDQGDEVLYAGDLSDLQDELQEGQTLSPFDGYWVYASGDANLEMSAPTPE